MHPDDKYEHFNFIVKLVVDNYDHKAKGFKYDDFRDHLNRICILSKNDGTTAEEAGYSPSKAYPQEVSDCCKKLPNASFCEVKKLKKTKFWLGEQ